MVNYKAIITILISCIIFLIAGIFIGKYKFSTHTSYPVIKEKIVYKTEWKTKIKYVRNPDNPKEEKPVFDYDNFNNLLSCYESPLQFREKIEKQYLFVTAFDDCKEATARYKIGQKGNWKIYLTIGGIGVVTGGAIVYFLRK